MPDIHERMAEIAEGIFGTEADPDQIPITDESRAKLDTLTPHWFRHRLDESGEPIAWVVVVPTDRDLAEAFLRGEIPERALLDRAEPRERYDALYLCAAITVPGHRRKGLATTLFQEALEAIPHTEDCLLFTWLYSEDGRTAFASAERKLGRPIRART